MKPQVRPNILLILLDCVRADHLSCYGYHRETTPNIDRLSLEGTTFLNAISPSPWTLPSHASLFTGTYVSRHKTDMDNRYLDGSLATMAETLGQQGYMTAGFSSNVWVSEKTGLSRGFKKFCNVNAPPFEKKGKEKLKKYKKLVNFFYWNYFYKRYDYGARKLNRLLSRFLKERDATAPFYVFTNYLEAHLQYEPPARFRHSFLTKEEDRAVSQDAWAYLLGIKEMTEENMYVLRALYDAEIRYLDYRVEEVIGMLRSHGILDDTMVIITADHGENIGDHGLMDHHFSLHDSLVHIPLIIRYPKVFPAGLRVERLVQSVDIYSTVAEILGVADGKLISQLQGKSVLPALAGKSVRSHAFSEYLVPNLNHFERRFPQSDYHRFDVAYRAARTEDYKLIQAIGGGSALYNLAADPSEGHDVLPGNEKKAKELSGALAEWTENVSSERDRKEIQFDDDTVRMLEGLGYM